MRYIAPIAFESSNPEDAMAKGQMRSNKEKKKNKQNGAPAPSPFAGMHSQANPNAYGKKS
jgi:hypothetical protein